MKNKNYRLLRCLMSSANYDNKLLAQKLVVSESTISHRLNSDSPFTADEMRAIGKLLHISPEQYYTVFIDERNLRGMFPPDANVIALASKVA